MSLETILAEDRRLVMLRSLAEAQGYELNEDILRQALGVFGHKAARDVVRADIEWLRQHDLVRVEMLYPASGELLLVTLLRAGQDVAEGRFHPGVARAPAP